MENSSKILRQPELYALSERELQIMTMIVNGQETKEISVKLHIDQEIVNSYRYRVFKKLGIDSDIALTILVKEILK